VAGRVYKDGTVTSNKDGITTSTIRYALVLAASLLAAPGLFAQDVPADYGAVLAALNKKGDFKDGVLKVNIPRGDLSVTIGGRPAPTPFGFGGWLALTKGSGGSEVMMGDLVLTEDEVNPVMSALLDNGLDVTALHNHFFWEQPRIFYMHVHGMGSAPDLARRVGPALKIIDQAAARAVAAPPAAPSASPAPGVDGAAVASIIGQPGERNGPVYKITIGRPDIDLRAHGAVINSRMGLNTWAAFAGTDADAMVAGDVAMLEPELTPVLKALRSSGIDVVAIHHHMTDVKPMVVFLHYFGRGPADRLARGVRAALDQLGKPVKVTRNILFLCPHGAAKSVLATAYFKEQARARGLDIDVQSAGTEPDPVVAPAVVEHLKAKGLEVPVARPRLVSEEDVAGADMVVSMGCDLSGRTVRGDLRRWDDVPSPSADFGAADAAIKHHVDLLVEELVRTGR
jgi:protein-tyrosine-phosphatase